MIVWMYRLFKAKISNITFIIVLDEKVFKILKTLKYLIT